MLKFFFLLFIPAIGISQNIKLYYIGAIDYDSIKKGAFITLTDEDNWVNKTDIDIENDIYQKKGIDNIQPISGIKRTDFLDAVGINETSRIYIYNMLLDSIFVYKVSEMPLFERPDLFSGIKVGFRIRNIDLTSMGKYNRNTFVYIGDDHPFQTGRVHQINWQEVDSTRFSSYFKSENYKTRYQPYISGKVNHFSTNDYTYLVKDLKSPDQNNRINARHLVIVRNDDDSLVFNQVYHIGESTWLPSLNTENEVYQWTGKIFKNKPTMIYGFFSTTFGCPQIDFIKGKQPPISILCDNRH